MPRIGERGYTFHAPYERVLERGRAQEVRQPAEYDGSTIAPSSGTYTLYDPDGDVVVTDSVTIGSDGVATYTIGASDLPSTLDLGTGYYEVWSLVMPDGSTRSPRRLVVLARKALDPPIGDGDMEHEYSGLAAMRGQALGSYQDSREQAWGQILRRLSREGAWSHLVYDASAFYDAHLALSLAKLFRSFHARTGDERWHREGRDQELHYDRAWQALAVAWDRDEDGKPDDPDDRTGVDGPINRNAAPYHRPCVSARD